MGMAKPVHTTDGPWSPLKMPIHGGKGLWRERVQLLPARRQITTSGQMKVQ